MRRATSNGFTKDKIVRVPFHYYSSVTLVAAAGNLSLHPAGFATRLSSIADAFAVYRLARLRYRLHPSVTQTGFNQAAYYPGVVDTPPTGAIEISLNMTDVMLSSRQTTPTQWMTVPPATLKGYFSWYKSQLGSADPAEEIQGVIYMCGSGTEVVILELDALYEFKNADAPANNPEIRDKRERDRILKLLALPEPPEKTEPIAQTAKNRFGKQ